MATGTCAFIHGEAGARVFPVRELAVPITVSGNLGKGASGATIQNLILMPGAEETAPLAA